jgi:predicted nucleic acid-binding protein
VRYWDSSAIVPLLAVETASTRLRQLQHADPAIATWWGTPVECVSALARLERDDGLTHEAFRDAVRRLRKLATTWTEVLPSDDVREHAIRLLRVHPLRAEDATQLAAAIIASDFQPGTLEFVSLDQRQREAAEREGFGLSAV